MVRLFVLMLALLPALSFSQQTGDFKIGFPSPDTSPDSLLTRDSLFIYFHVPVDYDSFQAYKLMVGNHGIGDPDSSYKIRNYLREAADSVGAIVICPDPYLQDQPRSRQVIDISIDSVLKWYNIDTSQMYIAGYSAGSDVASQYVLQNPVHKMKGLIWYAPGFFYQPNLAQQTDFPATCLCHGDQDIVSTILGQVQAIKDSFANHPNLPLFFNSIPGVSHTMNFPGITDEILECLRFIDDPEHFVPDPTTGIADQQSSFYDLKVFPNPISVNSIVSYSLRQHEDVSIHIYDLFGKHVASIVNQNQQAGAYNFGLTKYLSGIPSGMYMLEFKATDFSTRQKFLVTH